MCINNKCKCFIRGSPHRELMKARGRRLIADFIVSSCLEPLNENHEARVFDMASLSRIRILRDKLFV